MWKNKKRRTKRGLRRNTTVAAAIITAIALISLLYYANSYMNSHIGNANSKLTNVSTAVPANSSSLGQINVTRLQAEVLPAQGFILNAKWGNVAQKAVQDGTINVANLSKILNYSKEPLTKAELSILNGTSTQNITLNSSDALFVVDVLWGIGINNNNTIITEGSISQYSNQTYTAANGTIIHYTQTPYGYASTGGYGPLGNLQLGKLNLISLTPDQQKVVDYVATNSYRPCCDNPTSFPDCNHGAAALALVEIMASQGNGINATFTAVKDFNSLYFTQQYLYDAVYFASKGIAWNNVPPALITGFNFSSATGTYNIQQYVQKNLTKTVSGGAFPSCGA